MPLLVLALLSLLVFLAALAFAVARFVTLLHEVSSTAGALGEAIERITAGAERAAVRGEALAAATERLGRVIGRLERSRARLQVLLVAYGDARATLGSVVFVPRK